MCKKIDEKNKLAKTISKNRGNDTDELKTRLKDLSNYIKMQVRQCKEDYHKTKLLNISDTSAKWRFIEEIIGKTGNRSNLIESIKNTSGQIETEPKNIAHTFNNFFGTVASKIVSDIEKIGFSNNDENTLLYNSSIEKTIYLFPITCEEVKKIVDSLKNTNSRGKDQIPSTLLKKHIAEILDVLVPMC